MGVWVGMEGLLDMMAGTEECKVKELKSSLSGQGAQGPLTACTMEESRVSAPLLKDSQEAPSERAAWL